MLFNFSMKIFHTETRCSKIPIIRYKRKMGIHINTLFLIICNKDFLCDFISIICMIIRIYIAIIQ